MNASINRWLFLFARSLAVALLLVASSARAYDVTVVSGASSDGSWSGNTWIPTGSSTVSASEIATRLAGGAVTITATGSDTLTVAAGLAWSANTLTIHSGGNVSIDATLNGGGTAGLAVEYGQAAVAAGNSATFIANAPVNLASTASFSTKLGSDGDVKSYVIISSLGAPGSTTGTDLQGMAGNLAGNYALGTDIDANPTATWNPDGSGGYYGFAPIGTLVAGSTGNFDGLGHVIDGLTIKRNLNGVALFALKSGNIIANVGLTNTNIQGQAAVGSLAGVTKGATILNAYAEGGSVRASSVNGEAGGLVSSAAASADGTVWSNLIKVHATVDVEAYAQAGGLVGNTRATTISDSYATGNVTGQVQSGGLVGLATGESSLMSVYATGNVTGKRELGGLVGMLSGLNTAVSTAFATGNVTGSPDGLNIGGLVGTMSYNILAIPSPFVQNAYATGDVGGGDNVGGLVGSVESSSELLFVYSGGHVSGTGSVGGLFGSNYSNTFYPSVWNVETSGQANAVGTGHSAGITGLTTAQMKSFSSFVGAGWNASPSSQFGITDTGGDDRPWRIYEGETYPLLRVFLKPLIVAEGLPDYDGSATPLANIASITVGSVVVPPEADPTHLFYDGPLSATARQGDTLTLTSTKAGSFTADSNGVVAVSGVYSDQFGYDISGTTERVIATPGSAAGDVWVPNAVTWTDGNLVIDTAGEVQLPAGGLTWTNGTVSLRTPGTVVPAAIAGGAGSAFVLNDGNWTQNTAVLLAFDVHNFSLLGGQFLRATGGSGAVADSWLLTDIYGVQGMGTWLDKHFALANDIDASGTANWNGGHGFMAVGFNGDTDAPVGPGAIPFTGSLNGQNHAIDGLFINRGLDFTAQGLISYAAGAALSHITLSNANIAGAYHIGTLVGVADGATTIVDAHSSGAVDGAARVGGLVGLLSGSLADSDSSAEMTCGSTCGGLVGECAGSISNGHATGSLTFDNAFFVGGLAGKNSGSITDSYATGAVTGLTGDDYGGLVAENTGSILGSYASGDIDVEGSASRENPADEWTRDGPLRVGGLAGSNSGSVIQSYAGGNVAGLDQIGGLVGSNSGGISLCYALGEVTTENSPYHGVDARVGGLVGVNTSSIVLSYALGDVTAVASFPRAGGLIGEGSGGVNQSYARECYATGNVVATGHSLNGSGTSPFAGGLVGWYNGGTIAFAYAIGSAAASNDIAHSTPGMAGGLIGEADATAVFYSYATGVASAANVDPSRVGGLIGRIVSSGLFSNFWNTDTGVADGVGEVVTSSLDSASADGRTLADLMQLATFTPAWGARITASGGDGSRWRIYDNQTTPLLRGLLSPITVTAYNDAKLIDGVPYSGGAGAFWSSPPDPSLLLGVDPMTLFPLAYGGTSQGALNAAPTASCRCRIPPAGLRHHRRARHADHRTVGGDRQRPADRRQCRQRRHGELHAQPGALQQQLQLQRRGGWRLRLRPLERRLRRHDVHAVQRHRCQERHRALLRHPRGDDARHRDQRRRRRCGGVRVQPGARRRQRHLHRHAERQFRLHRLGRGLQRHRPRLPTHRRYRRQERQRHLHRHGLQHHRQRRRRRHGELHAQPGVARRKRHLHGNR